ncbi:uncharacterized protein HD556DRAFT_1435457 [Suillus plorans]|uniref:Helitron helicase-like domain-containing protein n=1 Tax=Suillus plorans TaxID=116603 RepID=A0A9P7A8D2_9AGAM|nr:uncharacterized protein HD556DRAFT_1435457 [Suillus plorans]KAG1784390.1 hypothetical protein HD556DRAFT_1435457 [Suillus plorans]
MASASSSALNPASSRPPPVSLVVSDRELVDDGMSVVSSCVLRKCFGFSEVSRERVSLRNQYPAGSLLPVVAPNLQLIVEHFLTFNREQYAEIARAHSIYVSSADRKDHIRDLLRVHLLKHPRRDHSNHVLPDPFAQSYCSSHAASQRDTRHGHVTDDPHFPTVLSFNDKSDIICEWQQKMSPESLKRGCCAVCAHNVCTQELCSVEAAKIPLHLLRNDYLPEHTLPCTYDLELYGRAILYAKEMYMCSSCHSALISKCPRQPVNSLANFQYYGHERLSPEIREAFSSASIYDLMLITHFYTYKSSLTQFWSAEEASQRYNKGNVAIRPQSSTELYNLLPPNRGELRDAMCVIFSGQKCPVLVTKSRVRKLIDFLITHNPWYQHSGVSYSQDNMDALFDEADFDADTGVPHALAICHLPTEDQASPDAGFNSRDTHDTHGSDNGDLVMEPVGYTEGDHSSQSREKMKLHALTYILDHKKFLLSRTGSKFVADSDPGLMSYLFPHLDPWDIGGFFHSGRTKQQHLSMQAQVRNLLRQDDSPFRNDPQFAFICWNMIQKQEVSRNTTFCIGLSAQRGLAKELTDIAPSLTSLADKWSHSVDQKPSTTVEKKAVRILRRLQASTRSIRSLMKKISTPALFVTLNPHDLTSIELADWSMMSSFEHAKIVASRPDAAAIAFDLQIRAFINIILKYKHGPAYYGMVEAQGRGTLHCNPSPQALREHMANEEGFQGKIYELPNDTTCVFETNEMDPRLELPPQIADLDDQSFAYEFQEFLTRLAIECNWHIHNDPCYKHIRAGEKRGDHNCQMRLDGSLQAVTSIDLRRWRGRVNNYTDLILFLLQSNTDSQFIGSGEAAKAAVFYITKYITKGNLPMYTGLQALEYATKMHEQKINRSLITKSEISHQQVMSYLMVKWYELDQDMESLPIDDRLVLEDNDTLLNEEQITVNIEDYALCPTSAHEFNDLCLWEFVERTVKERGDIPLEDTSEIEDSDNEELRTHSQYESHRLCMRKKQVIPVLLGDAIPQPDGAEEEYEKYCRCMMMLFTPWRDLRCLKGEHRTWIEAFEQETFSPAKTAIIRNMNVEKEFTNPW